MERPPLSTGQRLVGIVHVLLAAGFVVVGFVDTGSSDGFSDLARLLVVLIAGLYLLATATVAAVARYAMSGSAFRYAAIALGPPVLLAVAVLFIRGG